MWHEVNHKPDFSYSNGVTYEILSKHINYSFLSDYYLSNLLLILEGTLTV